MIRRAVHAVFLALLITPAIVSGQQPTKSFLPAEGSSRADELYKDGSAAVDEGRWEIALSKFTQVADLHGPRADGALYWKAYTLNKLGRRQDALSAISTLRRQYPASAWLKDAAALELEVNKAAGHSPDPEAETDEDIQLLALNTLMNSDPQRAVPVLKKLLMSDKSPHVKERALFILAQGTSAEAQQAILDAARGKMTPDLQRRAVEYLAMNPSGQHRAALAEIYKQSNDPAVRRSVLNSYILCACRNELFTVAQQERDPHLRRTAVNGLIALAARNEIHELYDSAVSLEEKKDILNGLVALGDKEGIAKISRTATDPEMRRIAVDGLIAMADKEPLANMYASEQDTTVKRKIVDGLAALADSHDLIAIDRKETDRQMHRYIVQRLSGLGGREVQDYMLEILNK